MDEALDWLAWLALEACAELTDTTELTDTAELGNDAGLELMTGRLLMAWLDDVADEEAIGLDEVEPKLEALDCEELLSGVLAPVHPAMLMTSKVSNTFFVTMCLSRL